MSTYLSPSISKLTAVLMIVCQLAAARRSLAQDLHESKTDTQRYEEVIAEERHHYGHEQTQEYIASGAAAIVIGLYGYYNTDPNPIIKVMYAATQTAGVLTIGQAIKERHTPRLALDIDDLMNSSADGKTVSIDLLKERIGRFKRNSETAETRTMTYTSSILSGLYFYNGYRERGPDLTLRNVYYFLGFNFAIASAIGVYKTYNPGNGDQRLTWSVFPYPALAYAF